MDISIDIPNRINSTIIYTFDKNDFIIDNEGNMLYKIPYSENTYWTNFKYSYYNTTDIYLELLDIEIIIITKDGYKYNIKESEKQFENKKWYDTEWPLPSIYTIGSKEGLYFKMKLPINNNNIIFSVLGFIDLYPKVENYILLSPFNTYQFIFYKYEDDILLEKGGSIWNVEHSDYIANIIKKACIIKLMKDY